MNTIETVQSFKDCPPVRLILPATAGDWLEFITGNPTALEAAFKDAMDQWRYRSVQARAKSKRGLERAVYADDIVRDRKANAGEPTLADIENAIKLLDMLNEKYGENAPKAFAALWRREVSRRPGWTLGAEAPVDEPLGESAPIFTRECRLRAVEEDLASLL